MMRPLEEEVTIKIEGEGVSETLEATRASHSIELELAPGTYTISEVVPQESMVEGSYEQTDSFTYQFFLISCEFTVAKGDALEVKVNNDKSEPEPEPAPEVPKDLGGEEPEPEPEPTVTPKETPKDATPTTNAQAEKKPASKNPKTADESDILLWMAIMVGAAAIIIKSRAVNGKKE